MPVNAVPSWTADPAPGLAARWVSAHLYYHDALDDLLRCAVSPLTSELTAGGLIEGFFFVRYWQGGPHLRLRVRLPEQADAAALQRVIEERTGQFFACSPSQTLVHPGNYLRSACRLARHEFGTNPTPIEPLRPNNSLRYVAYVPEADRLGGPVGVAAFEPHFIDSAILALELITADAGRQRRTGRALVMMLIAAAVFLPDARSLARFFRYRSRDWGIRNAAGDLDRHSRTEIQFEQRYQRQRTQLGVLARQLLDATRPGAGDHLDAISARWMRSVAALRDRLSTQPVSTESGLFQCLHKHNNRLGITTAEETYLLYLLHRTLTEITGTVEEKAHHGH